MSVNAFCTGLVKMGYLTTFRRWSVTSGISDLCSATRCASSNNAGANYNHSMNRYGARHSSLKAQPLLLRSFDATARMVGRRPHFTLDRYAALLRQVDIEDSAGVRLVLKNMERLGWVKFVSEEEFRFLRPFHRVFDKCLELAQLAASTSSAEPKVGAEI